MRKKWCRGKNIRKIEKEKQSLPGNRRNPFSIRWRQKMYWNYFQNNRWKLYGRTQTIQFSKEDIATWGIEDFHTKIGGSTCNRYRKETWFQLKPLVSPLTPLFSRAMRVTCDPHYTICWLTVPSAIFKMAKEISPNQHLHSRSIRNGLSNWLSILCNNILPPVIRLRSSTRRCSFTRTCWHFTCMMPTPTRFWNETCCAFNS